MKLKGKLEEELGLYTIGGNEVCLRGVTMDIIIETIEFCFFVEMR